MKRKQNHSDVDGSELEDLDIDARPDDDGVTVKRGRSAVPPRMVPGKGLVVPKAYLRDAFRFSSPTLEKFKQEGMPCDVGTNGVWQVSLAEFVRWHANRAVMEATGAAGEGGAEGGTLDMAKRREREALAGLRELELQRKRGEVISIADAAAVVEREYGALRSTLLAIPARVAQKLSALCGLKPEQCEDVVSDEVNAALELISNHDGGDWVPDVTPQQAWV